MTSCPEKYASRCATKAATAASSPTASESFDARSPSDAHSNPSDSGVGNAGGKIAPLVIPADASTNELPSMEKNHSSSWSQPLRETPETPSAGRPSDATAARLFAEVNTSSDL